MIDYIQNLQSIRFNCFLILNIVFTPFAHLCPVFSLVLQPFFAQDYTAPSSFFVFCHQFRFKYVPANDAFIHKTCNMNHKRTLNGSRRSLPPMRLCPWFSIIYRRKNVCPNCIYLLRSSSFFWPSSPFSLSPPTCLLSYIQKRCKRFRMLLSEVFAHLDLHM